MVNKRCVRVYVEGGAPGKTQDKDFRRGWKKFLNELHELAMQKGYNSLEIVRGKGRARTYELFIKHKLKFKNDLCVLLVDAETDVPTNATVWSIVGNRKGDEWQKPVWAKESHLYLMAHSAETWIVTDHDALQRFFKRGFDSKQLPTTNLEGRSKRDIERALVNATKNSPKGSYKHGQAHEIIETVDPEKVKQLKHGRRLFECLGSLIQSTSPSATC